MPDDSPGPQLLRNRIVQSRVYRERDRFIASVREEDVCRLASSYRNNDPCAYFEKPTCGSYNMCYLVQFGDGEKWVVRVPLAPCLAFGGRSKLESEIATTQLVVEKTRIPVPEIVAYDLGDTSGPPLSSFLILRYVQGERLSYARLKTLSDEQRTRLDTSLADIHIQLRRLEFLVANALENWTDMDWFAFRYTNWKCYKGVDLKERVGSFIDADPARRVLMARKFREGLAYKAEVDQLRNDGLADTKSSTNEHTSIEP